MKAGVSFECLAEGARCEGLACDGWEEFETKLLHGVIHLQTRCEEYLRWTDDEPIYEEQPFESFRDESEDNFLLLCLQVCLSALVHRESEERTYRLG